MVLFFIPHIGTGFWVEDSVAIEFLVERRISVGHFEILLLDFLLLFLE